MALLLRELRIGDVRRYPSLPRSYAPGTPQRGTVSYGYYEEVRVIPDECLSQPGMVMGVGPGYAECGFLDEPALNL
jgi:hypothetical protein